MMAYDDDFRNNEFFKKASRIISLNKTEFEEYLVNNRKLQAVKSLKDHTGGGLKESKDVIDLWWTGDLPNYIRDDRRLKLEVLAKKPLAENLIIKIKNDDNKLLELLMTLSIDRLFEIDDFFNN